MNTKLDNPKIVCAANQHKNGAIVLGARHFDSLMRETIFFRKTFLPKEEWNFDTCEQGFVDQYGNFLSREKAWVIAVKNSQIKRLVGNQNNGSYDRTDVELFSENLY